MGQLELRSIQDAYRRDKDGKWIEVDGIAGKTFLIKPYQRGYRWEKDNVTKLLGDIDEYIKHINNESGNLIKNVLNRGSTDDFYDFYCLQALSVKEENGEYELIDGQQRLTTMFLIYELLYLFTDGDRKKDPVYKIHYRRYGEESYDLTQSILDIIPNKINGYNCKEAYKKGKNDKKNNRDYVWFDEYKRKLKENIRKLDQNESGSLKIDLYYLSEAAEAIVDFVYNYNDGVDSDYNLQALLDIIQRNVLFIWYKPSGAKAEDEFSSLNANKVYLTNAELIKALVLKKDEEGKMFENAGHRWEAIEQGLSRSEFWSFISDAEKATRIDLMLELYTRQGDAGYRPNPYNTYALFDWYEKKHNQKGEFSKDVLEGIEGIYDRLCEWYDDVDIFHCIGLLTNFRAKMMPDIKTQEDLLKCIFDAYADKDSTSRDDFTKELKRMMKERILSIIKEEDKYKEWEDYLNPSSGYFQYDDPSQQANIKAILWTLNAWEVIESAENNTGEGNNRKRKPVAVKRLPFSQINGDLQKKDVWSLEHIWPQHPDDSDPLEKDKYNKIINDAKNALGADVTKTITDSVDSIWNMALLTRGTNASVSNGTLSEKRKNINEIILKGGLVEPKNGKAENKAETKYTYIPASTVNVFNLLYNAEKSDESSECDRDYWTVFDSKNYLERITECLNSFLGEAYPAGQNGGSAS